MDVLHTAIDVSDLDATTEFYEDALGLEYSWEFDADGIRNYYVAGDDGTEIQFRYNTEEDVEIDPSGIDHLAVSVENTEAEVERLLEETDTEVVKGPLYVEAADATVAFITDPDGYVVELVQSHS